jgi:hypothetical protein
MEVMFLRNVSSYKNHTVTSQKTTFFIITTSGNLKSYKIEGCFIFLTDCDERTDVNIVQKQEGTILSDGINKDFLFFLCGFMASVS